MSARDVIRTIVEREARRLDDLSRLGSLAQEELDRLETLAKTALVTDKLDADKEGDDGRTDAELECAALPQS